MQFTTARYWQLLVASPSKDWATVVLPPPVHSRRLFSVPVQLNSVLRWVGCLIALKDTVAPRNIKINLYTYTISCSLHKSLTIYSHSRTYMYCAILNSITFSSKSQLPAGNSSLTLLPVIPTHWCPCRIKTVLHFPIRNRRPVEQTNDTNLPTAICKSVNYISWFNAVSREAPFTSVSRVKFFLKTVKWTQSLGFAAKHSSHLLD